MKKMFFGLELLLSGIIGFVGWCIAAVLRVERIVLFLFAVMAVAGLIISVIEYKKE